MRVTATFSWQIPSPQLVPYADAVRDLIFAVDASVASVQQGYTATQITLVWSWFPTGVASLEAVHADSAWLPGSGYQSISASPAGPVVGSFVVHRNVRHMLLDVRATWPGSVFLDSELFALEKQLILNPGSQTLDVNAAGSAYLRTFAYHEPWRLLHVVPVAGPGEYSIELRMRNQHAITGGHFLSGPATYITAVIRPLT